MANIPTKWIVGNWKMHKSIPEAVSFAKEIIPQLSGLKDHVGLAVPATSLHALSQICKGTPLELGAQNVYSQKEGAFTGEISPEMALDAGASFTLIGHSERRHIFHESDASIHKKVLHALRAGMKVILCIGETGEERNNGAEKEVLLKQLQEALKEVDRTMIGSVTIAYEPVWAIGTGVAATPEIAQTCHAFCRELLTKLFGAEISKKVKILYGGSVQPENVATFLEKEDIDGVLVGKGSLTSPSFAKIIHFRDP